MRCTKVEEVLRGKKLEAGLIKEVAEGASMECQPITDVRASAEYRKEMVKVYTRRALEQILGK